MPIAYCNGWINEGMFEMNPDSQRFQFLPIELPRAIRPQAIAAIEVSNQETKPTTRITGEWW